LGIIRIKGHPMVKKGKFILGIIRIIDAKVLMFIGFLCPISVEGVIRGLKWGISPKGAETLSSHHIWMFIPPVRL
jgi:hypothetical protein